MRPTHVPLLLLALSACQKHTPPPPASDAAPAAGNAQMTTDIRSLPRWQPGEGDEVQDALVAGTLEVQNGCLVVRTGTGDAYAVLWPPHVELAPEQAGTAVRDTRTGVVARVGSPVRLSGGEVPNSAGSAGRLRGSLPAACPGALWLAAGVQAP